MSIRPTRRRVVKPHPSLAQAGLAVRRAVATVECLEGRRLLAADGPELIRDINHGTSVLEPSNLASVGSVGYFVGQGA